MSFRIRVRYLEADQEKAFRKLFDQDDSIEPKSGNALAKLLSAPGRIRVLELADFSTVGLAGMTRPDLPNEGVQSRFVNFFFDFGRAHEESGDGGTYGFGRSSLYTSGKASMIVVDSLIDSSSGSERRFMACRIGKNFEVVRGSDKGRYSGRHFWGEEREGVAQPLVGAKAEAIAGKLGLPERGPSRTGTTILIPWPVDEFGNGEGIAHTLLRHLWPKMVPSDVEPTIKFDVEVDGQRYPVPDPSTTQEYRLFVDALRLARMRKDGPQSRIISTLRPRHQTGFLGLTSGIVRMPVPAGTARDDEEDAEEPESIALNHVALMRPSELVVTYLPVSGAEDLNKSWAGVFICDNSDTVRTAFARAEPPAHDDWVADRLTNKEQKYIVRKTVKSLLPEAVRDLLGVSVLGGLKEPEGPSLAGASARFSEAFLSGDGQGASRVPGGSGSGNGGGKGGTVGTPRIRVTPPMPSGLEYRKDARLARFRATVEAPEGSRIKLTATPAILAEGTMDDPPEGMRIPEVVEWTGGHAAGNTCLVQLDRRQKDIEIVVAIYDEYGITLACTAEKA